MYNKTILLYIFFYIVNLICLLRCIPSSDFNALLCPLLLDICGEGAVSVTLELLRVVVKRNHPIVALKLERCVPNFEEQVLI